MLIPPPDSASADVAQPAKPGQREGLRLTWLGAVSAVFLVALMAVAIEHVISRVNFGEVIAFMHNLPPLKIGQAVLLTALGYWMLTFYDFSALYYLKRKVSYRTIAFAAATGYAISNNVGWAVISGAGVRLRAYAKAGLSPGEVAKVVVFSTTTFTLGLSFTGALAVLTGPEAGSALLKVPEIVIQAFGALTLVALAALCVMASIMRKPVRLWRWELTMPSFGIVSSQIVIASVELVVAAGVLWALMPPMHGLSFIGFLSVYCGALVIAIFSHVPGGLGVFEGIVMLALAEHDIDEALLGALLAYRFIYYVVPLALAGMSIIVWELYHHGGAAVRRFFRRCR
jgi:glycosyltransferase 2 family protein